MSDFQIKKFDLYKTELQNIQFDPAKYNARYKMPTSDRIKRLAVEIKNEKQKNPIAVYYEKGEKLPHVVEGFCRYLAIKQINEEEFDKGLPLTPVVFRKVSSKYDLQQILLANIAENEVRFPLTIIDKAYGMKRLYDEFKMSQQDIADKYGVSQNTVSNYLRLMNLSEELKDKIHDGNLNYTDAMMLAKLTPSQQATVIEAVEQAAVSNVDKASSKVDKAPSVKEAITKVTNGQVKFKRSIKDFIEMLSIEESEAADSLDTGAKPKLPLDYFYVLNQVARWFDGDLDTESLFKKIQEKYVIKGK